MIRSYSFFEKIGMCGLEYFDFSLCVELFFKIFVEIRGFIWILILVLMVLLIMEEWLRI